MNAHVGMTGAPLVVAVTGGIASGKSALTAAFEALGVPVADADVVARESVAPGSAGLAELVDEFGAGVLDQDGALDRRRMREWIFDDVGARRRLEAIVHPRVRIALQSAVAGWRHAYGLLAIPLLAENAHAYRWVDRVLVVDVPESAQIQRLVRRDDVDRDLAQAMVNAQASRAQRLAIADDVHDSGGPIESLPARVAALNNRYLELARRKRAGDLPPAKILSQA